MISRIQHNENNKKENVPFSNLSTYSVYYPYSQGVFDKSSPESGIIKKYCQTMSAIPPYSDYSQSISSTLHSQNSTNDQQIGTKIKISSPAKNIKFTILWKHIYTIWPQAINKREKEKRLYEALKDYKFPFSYLDIDYAILNEYGHRADELYQYKITKKDASKIEKKIIDFQDKLYPGAEAIKWYLSLSDEKQLEKKRKAQSAEKSSHKKARKKTAKKLELYTSFNQALLMEYLKKRYYQDTLGYQAGIKIMRRLIRKASNPSVMIEEIKTPNNVTVNFFITKKIKQNLLKNNFEYRVSYLAGLYDIYKASHIQSETTKPQLVSSIQEENSNELPSQMETPVIYSLSSSANILQFLNTQPQKDNSDDSLYYKNNSSLSKMIMDNSNEYLEKMIDLEEELVELLSPASKLNFS